jgi:hypothetical protein
MIDFPYRSYQHDNVNDAAIGNFAYSNVIFFRENGVQTLKNFHRIDPLETDDSEQHQVNSNSMNSVICKINNPVPVCGCCAKA